MDPPFHRIRLRGPWSIWIGADPFSPSDESARLPPHSLRPVRLPALWSDILPFIAEGEDPIWIVRMFQSPTGLAPNQMLRVFLRQASAVQRLMVNDQPVEITWTGQDGESQPFTPLPRGNRLILQLARCNDAAQSLLGEIELAI